MNKANAFNIYYVATSGNDANNGISPSSPFLTLSKALNVATSGSDIIEVADGTYNDINLNISHTVTINGQGSTTIFECAGNPFASINANNVKLKGMLIQDCQSSSMLITSAGGLNISGNNATIENCNFSNASAGSNGGAIVNLGTNTIFMTDTFNNCYAGLSGGGSGGAIYSTKGISIYNSYFTVCSASGDYSTAGLGGGAIAIVGGSLDQRNTITNSTFTSCTVSQYAQGGAIYLGGSVPILTILNCSFANNNTGGDNSYNNGGALSIAGFAVVSSCTFLNNITGSGSGADGGAIYVSGAILVSSCIFDSNGADNNGGAIAFEGSGTTASTVIYSSISNSIANSGLGNAIYHNMTNASLQVVSSLFFINDNSGNGTNASLYLGSGSKYTINDCTIYNPSDGNTDSYAIWVLPYAASVSTTIENSIIMDLNHSDIAVHTGAAGGSTNVVMTYCIGNINNNFSPFGEHVSVGSGTAWSYTTAASIGWVDPDNLNYMNAFKLTLGSPANSHGHALADPSYSQDAYDLNQYPRPANPSLGAFQYGDNATLLPIQLINFTAVQQNKVVLIKWQTASQLNNASFTIEKSINPASNPIQLVTVAKIPGAGNSAELLNYMAIDSTPNQGISYYRLTQTDYDGKTTSYNWVPLRFTQSNSFISVNQFYIFPNPCKNGDIININYNAKADLSLTLYNIQGEFQFNQTISPSLQTNGLANLNIPNNLPAGIYFLRGVNANSSFVQKVILE